MSPDFSVPSSASWRGYSLNIIQSDRWEDILQSDIYVEGIHPYIHHNGKASSYHQTSVFLQPRVEENQSDIQNILVEDIESDLMIFLSRILKLRVSIKSLLKHRTC